MSGPPASDGGARLPRFLPPDPRVEEPYLLTPQTALRIAILGAIALVAFAVLLLRLWSLQVLSGGHYRAEALNNQLRRISIEAPRGQILDANGNVLVRNTVSKAVVLWPSDMPKGNGRDTELKQLSRVLNMRVSRIEALIRAHTDTLTPVVLRRSIHADQYRYISERQNQFRGVQFKLTYLRYYNAGTTLAQTLGYVGAITADEYKRLRKDGYRADDTIGQSGVEAAYDQYLRGSDGIDELRVDSRGRPVSVVTPVQQPKPGLAVRLTIDLPLQRAAEKAIRYGIQLARQSDCFGCWSSNGGAIVALDPNTGAILAMASYPTYKPSVWNAGRSDPSKLRPLLDEAVARRMNWPGVNRVIDAVYPPGSTWKPVTALAALETHIVSPNEYLQCTPSLVVPNPFGGKGQRFDNWDPYVDQPMAMPEALARSCDTYFYRLGLDFYDLPSSEGHPLQQWAAKFGFGKSTGVDVGPEALGTLPTPEWREKTFKTKIDQAWKPGDSVQLAIGQKDLRVTPLQLARFYAMIANGGNLVTPHVVQDVEVPPGAGNTSAIKLRTFESAPTPTGLDPAALQTVQQGLYQATHSTYGTAAAVFGNFPIPIAGKTGTAEEDVQLPGSSKLERVDQSLFCAYGPYGRPKIVVCAVIENGGHGGTAAAPAALKVLEAYFGKQAISSSGQSSD